MIRQKNLTPFVFGYRLTSRKPPQRELVGVVRATFRLAPGEPLVPLAAKLTSINLDDPRMPERAREGLAKAAALVGQGTIAADRFAEDDPNMVGALEYASDLADFKLHGEWTVKAHCHVPSGRPRTTCDVGVSVAGRSKTLRVTGPRAWVDRVAGGKASDPVAFTSLPLDWSCAYGGPDFPDNPVGRGHPFVVTPERQESLADLPPTLTDALRRTSELPLVEDPRDLVTTQGHVPRPAGFGPVSPWWPARRAKLGKEYGEEYRAKYAPFHPRDLDWTFFQAAPPDQWLPGYFRGDEEVVFTNLHPGASELRTKLPGLRIRVFVLRSGLPVEVPMVLDTLHADLDAGSLTLTWRGLVPVAQDDFSDVPYALVASEPLVAAQMPAETYHGALEAFAADPVGLAETPLPRLQAFARDLESGALARDIEALPEDEHLMGAVASRIGKGLIPEAQLATLREATREAGRNMLAQSASSGAKLKRAVITELERAQDLPAPPAANDATGKPSFSPAIRRALGDLAAQQRAIPEVDWSDMNEALADSLATVPDDGVRSLAATLGPDAILDRPLPEPGPGADFSWHDLSDRDLRGYDLSGANFEGATLSRARLDGCNLAGARLVGAALSRANLTGARCRGADLTRAVLSRTTAADADFREARLERATLLDADLASARLDGAKGDGAQLRKTNLSAAKLEGASFEFCVFDECTLEGAMLARANVKRSLFRKCALGRASLAGADLTRAGFLECDLTEARLVEAFGLGTNWLRSNLTRADLRYAILPENLFLIVHAVGANLAAADLPKSRFYKAGLRDANLEHANLLDADLRKAVLSGATFRGANLYEAKVLEAMGTDVDLRGANLKAALFDRSQLVTK
ncbi:MAG: DUF2169 domain-containing protein [Deltaproteobacteria bacterium]|nr:DUF2169 domain-containing protein [Deltaproteobacteria bacterium]